MGHVGLVAVVEASTDPTRNAISVMGHGYVVVIALVKHALTIAVSDRRII